MSEINLENLKELLEYNLQETKEIKKQLAEIKRYFKWRLILNIIWIIVVVAPLVFAFFYIPPLIKDLTNNVDIFKVLGI